MSSTKLLIGQIDYNELIEAELNEHGVIKGFNGFDIINKDRSYDENYYLSLSSWCHEVKVNGITYKTGEKPPVGLQPYWIDEYYKQIYDNDDFYYAEGMYCSECGLFHDFECSDQYKFVDGETFCNECITADMLLCKVDKSSDLFNAPNICDVADATDFIEVGTLFCDSSGFGAPNERALTKEQALLAVDELISKNKNNQLYAGITGMGQFQVYVTVYKRK